MLSGRWIISHRCSWRAVYVFFCNARSNLIVIVLYACISLYSINCPSVICLSNMSLSLWRDTTSELWIPVLFSLLIYNQTTLCLLSAILFFILLQTLSFHTIHLILCFQQAGEIDILTVSLGQSILVVVCRSSFSGAIAIKLL